MQVEIDVPAQRIADMMIGAIEGGSIDWCHRILLDTDHQNLSEKPWYASPELYDGRTVVMSVRHDNPGPGDDVITTQITERRIKDGLALMQQHSAQHFGDLIDETDDANTADVFLQYVVLGEIVFG